MNDLADDLSQINWEQLLEWFEDDIEADDITELLREMQAAIKAARARGADPDALERVERWIWRLKRVAVNGSVLTGRYSDDLDE